MKKRRRLTVPALLVCAGILLGLYGCAQVSPRPITDVNDLEGRRVGVCLAWSADYLLTGREDMRLYRYDNRGGMLLALCYHQVDAVATEYYGYRLIEALTTGIGAVEPPIAEEGFTFFFGSDEEEACEQFNTFLREFMQTPEYDGFSERVFAFDGENADLLSIEPEGTGRVLNVGASVDCYPSVFLDAETGAVTGFEVELLTRFANRYGYRLDFTPTDYTDGELGLRYGRYDVMIGQLSELYREDVEAAGLRVSDDYIFLPMYLMQVTDPDGLRILGNFDE